MIPPEAEVRAQRANDPFAKFLGGLWDQGVGMLEAYTGVSDYKAQQSTLDYMKEAQQTTWEREDSAIQRRVADLAKAGLNPVLAAGQGAASSSPIRVEAPQWGQRNPIGAAQVTASALADLAVKQVSMNQTQAQTDKTRAEIALVESQKAGVDLDNQLKGGTVDAKISIAKADAAYAFEQAAASLKKNEAMASEAEASAALRRAEAVYAENLAYVKKEKSWEEYHIASAERLIKSVAADAALELGLDRARAELLQAQAQAIGAAALAAQQNMNAEFWNKLGISPVAGGMIKDAVDAIIRALTRR